MFHLICITTLRLASSFCWTTFQAKNNVRSVPASSVITLVCAKAITRVTYVCGSGERNGTQRRTNHDASTGAAAVDKRVCLATVNSEEIKPVALAIIKLHFSEGIS